MISGNFDKEQFNMVYNFIPFLDDLFNETEAVAITDTQKYLYVKQSKIYTLPFKKDDPLNDAVKIGIKKGEKFTLPVPRGISEYDCDCHVYPLKEEGEIVGLFMISIPLENKHKLLNIIDGLSSSMSQINGGMKDVAAGVEELTLMNSKLLEHTNKTTEKAKNTHEIINIIQNISSQTNLLGLNASIEAARAGEYGRGFSVVAEEIRKLSDTSKDSIEKIGGIISDISDSVTNINTGLSTINTVSQKQSAAAEEITSSLNELEHIATYLTELSKHI